jgi:hypothetical protein
LFDLDEEFNVIGREELPSGPSIVLEAAFLRLDRRGGDHLIHDDLDPAIPQAPAKLGIDPAHEAVDPLAVKQAR